MGLAKATSNTNNSLAPTKIFDLNRSRVEMEQNGKQKGAHAHA